MQAAYTWSKTLTDLSYLSAFGFPSANSNNASDLAQQYGPATFVRPQRLVVNYSYDLPFGTHHGALGSFIEGWSVSGVTVVQNGLPITIGDTSAGTIYGISGSGGSSGYARAQMCQGMTYGDIATRGSVEERLGGNSGGPGYCNRSAFCAPLAIGNGTGYGDSGIGIILGPGQFNWDIPILKSTRVTEHQTAQLRAEFFDSFNHPQFNNPNNTGILLTTVTNRSSATFGQITTTSVNPRVIQLAMKYSF